MNEVTCRKCGRNAHQIKGFLSRVNEYGVKGVWECRPSCEAQLTSEERIVAAIEDKPA